MTGKQLKARHRRAMWSSGGLAQVEDKDGNLCARQTSQYQPLKVWLKAHGRNSEINALRDFGKSRRTRTSRSVPEVHHEELIEIDSAIADTALGDGDPDE